MLVVGGVLQVRVFSTSPLRAGFFLLVVFFTVVRRFAVVGRRVDGTPFPLLLLVL